MPEIIIILIVMLRLKSGYLLNCEPADLSHLHQSMKVIINILPTPFSTVNNRIGMHNFERDAATIPVNAMIETTHILTALPYPTPIVLLTLMPILMPILLIKTHAPVGLLLLLSHLNAGWMPVTASTMSMMTSCIKMLWKTTMMFLPMITMLHMTMITIALMTLEIAIIMVQEMMLVMIILIMVPAMTLEIFHNALGFLIIMVLALAITITPQMTAFL